MMMILNMKGETSKKGHCKNEAVAVRARRNKKIMTPSAHGIPVPSSESNLNVNGRSTSLRANDDTQRGGKKLHGKSLGASKAINKNRS
eukprot:12418140-Karenia_brevis.AAC.1